MKILFVCLGNIHRSPAGDIIMRKIVSDNNLNWEIDSCAISSTHIGESPAPTMQDTAQQYGYDMSILRSRQITQNDLQNFDIIFAMDSSHYNHIKQMGVGENKLKMFLEIAPEYGIDVPDPYYTGTEDEVFNICIDTCNRWYEKLIK